jgi:N6-adenosine-specific RNA methylase IME4
MKIIDVAPMKIINVGLGGIAVNPERLRALRKNKVAELAESMKARGLLQPIVLRTHDKGSGYILIAGRHRFEAAKLLEWEGIPAIVYEGMKADEAELAEIDENLIRAGLSEAEQAMHYARRKELYEKLYPETKSTRSKGGGGRRRKNGSQDETHSRAFIDDAAKKSGEGRSTVARKVARGEKVVVLSEIARTCLDQGTELDALAKLPPDEQRKLAERARAGEKVSAKTRVKQVRRAEREQQLAEKTVAAAIALGHEPPASVIVADPALRFKVRSEHGEDRSAENHYQCGTVEEMITLKPPMADDAIVFMWTSGPHLLNSIKIVEGWGLDYKTYSAWDKEIEGTGYICRSVLELILIATTKGSKIPAPAPGQNFPQLFRAKRGKHSEKPDIVYDEIERLYPNLIKLEMFARKPRPGWRTWGNEVSSLQSDQAPPEVENVSAGTAPAPDNTSASMRSSSCGCAPSRGSTRRVA